MEDDASEIDSGSQQGDSFETKRLHRTDAHGIGCRIERAGNSSEQSEQDDDEHDERLHGDVDIPVQSWDLLEGNEEAGSGKQAETAPTMETTADSPKIMAAICR